jgi:3-dehydroquinate dehydratase/shikimate dehydrogenase
MHNSAYREMNLNALYLRFDVEPGYEEFSRFIDRFRTRPWLDLFGMSVTIPHKSNAIRYLKNHDMLLQPLAEKIGAVNTLVFTSESNLEGYNTDYFGILETLSRGAGLNQESLCYKNVAVLGAGGVSRAIVSVMAESDANVTIYNRTYGKAKELAEEFPEKSVRCARWEDRNSLIADLVINGTSIGMFPNSNESPLPPDTIKPGTVVFDTVYNPLETLLLKSARANGAIGLDGASMLAYQAVRQIELWLTELKKQKKISSNCLFDIPTDIMKNTILQKLKK